MFVITLLFILNQKGRVFHHKNTQNIASLIAQLEKRYGLDFNKMEEEFGKDE